MASAERAELGDAPKLDSDELVAGLSCTVRNVEHLVAARSALTLPVLVPPRSRLSISFQTVGYDIAFGAFARRKSDGVTRELQAAKRVNSHLVPQFFQLVTQESDEMVALHFENSYSLLTAKPLLLRLCVEPAPGESPLRVTLIHCRVGFAQFQHLRAATGMISASLASGGVG